MLYTLRYLLAAGLFHPLEGLTAAAWFELLRRERFRIGPLRWPRALWITAHSLVNTVAARRVAHRHGTELAACQPLAPVFILGHYRSGTTHLHSILAEDLAFASPSRFQAFHPSTFLATERWLAPLVEPLMLPRRVQEDEIALMNLSRLSPYLDWCFPQSKTGYARTHTFRAAPLEEVRAWQAALLGFLKSLTLRYQRPILLKSPPHTGRVRWILDVFPDARFVHIRRNPYAVYASTLRLLRAVQPIFRLQGGPRRVDPERVLQNYTELYDAFLDDQPGIPPGQLVELNYEALANDPLPQLARIYEGLDLGAFAAVRPRFEAYLASVASHQGHAHRRLDEATRARIAATCARCFAAWGYPV